MTARKAVTPLFLVPWRSYPYVAFRSVGLNARIFRYFCLTPQRRVWHFRYWHLTDIAFLPAVCPLSRQNRHGPVIAGCPLLTHSRLAPRAAFATQYLHPQWVRPQSRRDILRPVVLKLREDRMKRREFIAASTALLVSPRRSLAQGTRRRVGFLALWMWCRRPFRTRGLRGCETTAGSMEET